ncbi:hypothetical protein TRIUR3_31217 [Triticum urartu]|uniref:Uncharacterized protein n=1 Tax=Triticum urartu TaxID=4572 RepID=M8A1X8_TRIUA|nr:hypothetical protein TRIUR3_31217 [Triticum urartu]
MRWQRNAAQLDGGKAAPDLGSGAAREVRRFVGQSGSGVQQQERRTRKEAKAQVAGRLGRLEGRRSRWLPAAAAAPARRWRHTEGSGKGRSSRSLMRRRLEVDEL